MAKEVVIKSWCDIEFDQDPSNKVEAETRTWFLYGTRMEIELCARHRSEITIDRMDEVVQAHGRVWEDPEAPPAKKKRRRSRAEPLGPAGEGDDDVKNPPGVDSTGRPYVLKQAVINEDGSFTCLVKDCPRDEPLPKITSLRMHQRKVHGIHLDPEEKVGAKKND